MLISVEFFPDGDHAPGTSTIHPERPTNAQRVDGIDARDADRGATYTARMSTRHVDEVVLADGRRQLLQALDGVDALARVYDRWSVLDVVAHVLAWDEACARVLSEIPAGARDFEVTARPDDGWAAWNEVRIEEARGIPFAGLMTRMHAAREAMLDAAARLDVSLLDLRVKTPSGVEDTVRGHLIARAMHDGEHAAAIAEATSRVAAHDS